MAVAFMKDKRVQYYDSFGGNGERYTRDIFQYIKDEHQDKLKAPLPDADSWTLISRTTSDTPRQRNGYDCGVFVCTFADFIAQGLPLYFGQDDLPRCRQRIALALLGGHTALEEQW
jgi:sentrin-specific protease 1